MNLFPIPRTTDRVPFYLLLAIVLAGFSEKVRAQAPEPPLPVEIFAGHESLYYQVVAKKQFRPESRFAFFSLATYTADYRNDQEENTLITIGQVIYELNHGFGLMAGTDINSVVGFSPIAGPTFTYASKKWLAVTTLSYFMNGDHDLKLFGLYEYTPAINQDWGFYSRLQFITNNSLGEGSHNKSYVYLRGGLQRESLIFGLGANLDWSGPDKTFGENYGLFARWEF